MFNSKIRINFVAFEDIEKIWRKIDHTELYLVNNLSGDKYILEFSFIAVNFTQVKHFRTSLETIKNVQNLEFIYLAKYKNIKQDIWVVR